MSIPGNRLLFSDKAVTNGFESVTCFRFESSLRSAGNLLSSGREDNSLMKVFASSRLALMASLMVALISPRVLGLGFVFLNEIILSENLSFNSSSFSLPFARA